MAYHSFLFIRQHERRREEIVNRSVLLFQSLQVMLHVSLMKEGTKCEKDEKTKWKTTKDNKEERNSKKASKDVLPFL